MNPHHVKALFLDLSGVLYEGGHRLDGAVETVERARQAGLVLRFVTNTATKSRHRILDKLHDMDIPLKDDELFTAPMAAMAYVRDHDLHPYCLVHSDLAAEFEEVAAGHNPDAVVLGDAREGLHYDSLNRAFTLCREGAPLIGIGYNKYFKDDEGFKLDAGAFIHAIEWAAGVEAVITGKPSPDFFHAVVASTGFDPGDCLMVGDDAEADVAAAVDAGLRGCLVRTGKFSPGDENRLPDTAHTIDSISELFS